MFLVYLIIASILLAIVCFIFCLIFALTIGLIITVDRMYDHNLLERYNAVKQTIATAREKGETTDLERAALTKEILNWNARIASKKYWNNTFWFDVCHVDEVLDQLEPLE